MKMTSENDATNVQQFPKAIFEILLSHRSESKQMNVHLEWNEISHVYIEFSKWCF